MAAKSLMDVALENIDTKIAALQHARDLVVEAFASEPQSAAAPKKRGRKPKKMGLPTDGTAWGKQTTGE